MTAQSLADRLEHAIATASNDDYSKVGTRERERHVERIGVMQDCLASLRQSGEAIERAAKVAEETKLLEEAWGALNFILAFYDPGQRYLDTNAWKQAEASGRRVHAKLRETIDARRTLNPEPPR